MERPEKSYFYESTWFEKS